MTLPKLEIEKICTKCKVSKKLDEFHKDKRGKDGLHIRCKLCQRSYQRNYISRPKAKERMRIYRETHRENMKNYRERPENKEKARHRNLSNNFWNPIQFEAAWDSQNGLCEICKLPMLKFGCAVNSVCADHSHTRKKARGLLCSKCNFTLGFIEKNIYRIHEFFSYLQVYGDL